MKLSIYQPKRKDSDGKMGVYLVINNRSQKVLMQTGIKTELPIKKIGGLGMGVMLDRKEPSGRVKLHRLEDIYRRVEEYCINNPNARPGDVKQAALVIISPKSRDGDLAKTMKDYSASGRVGESTAAIMLRTATKVVEFDAAAGWDIGEDWLDRFVEFLRKQGVKTNGIGLHLRNIRTVFNYARKRKLTKEYPFLDYKIKVEKQAVRAMSLTQLRELRDYPCEAWQVEYRDIFMLSFYLAGINIGDLLKCERIINGRITYKRTKTGKPISVPVYPEAQEIINKYKGVNYMLNACDRYKDYHGYMHRMNDGLKKIGKVTIVPDKVGKMRKREVKPVFEGLSTYVARYTFASLAAECGVQRDVIAACLGHSWSDVTSHYVAYSQKQIDDAIRQVIDYVNDDK